MGILSFKTSQIANCIILLENLRGSNVIVLIIKEKSYCCVDTVRHTSFEGALDSFSKEKIINYLISSQPGHLKRKYGATTAATFKNIKI